LSGTVIADFGRGLAGPYCTMLLADMGATVIKVESPIGDETRAWMPPEHEGKSTYYLSINRNKLSIELDFSDPRDLATARELAARADVVIENFKPGGLEKFGLDYQSVAAGNPDVIFASITGFGTAGGASLPGYDLLVQAASGLMSLTGAPETEPFRAGVAVVDVFTGMHACIGILAALNHRRVTGEGQRVEVNLMSSALSGLVNQTGAYAIAGVVPTRMGNEHPSIYPYEPIATGDGEIVLAIGNDRQFRVLCRELGTPELVEDPRFAFRPTAAATDSICVRYSKPRSRMRPPRSGSNGSPQRGSRARRSRTSQPVSSSPSASAWIRSFKPDPGMTLCPGSATPSPSHRPRRPTTRRPPS